MTRDTVSLGGGTGLVRAWRIDQVGAETHLEIWTPLRGKLLLTVVCAVVALPAPMLWLEIAGFRISHWVLATLYSLAALCSIAAVVRFAGRERVRVRRRELVVEHFDVVTWTIVQLETTRGIGIWARGQWWAGFTRSLLVGSHVRAASFGYWLEAAAAERIALLLRDVLPAREPGEGRLDGVVRRVERLRQAFTVDGADDLVLEEGRQPRVFRGTLRGTPLVMPWVALVPLALLLFVVLPHGPARIGWFLGSMIVAAGLIVCRGGVVDQLTCMRARRLARQSPREPWRAVPEWHSSVMGRSFLRRGATQIGLALLFVILSAFTLSGWVGSSSGSRTFAGCAMGLAALVFIYRAQNVFFQGLTEVRLREMPYRTPGDIAIDFAVARSGAQFAGIAFTLTRLVQVPRAGRPAAVGFSHIGHYELPEDEPPPGPGEQVTARFTLPADAGGTALDASRSVYWELLVEGETSCGAYAESFLIPIYDADPADPT